MKITILGCGGAGGVPLIGGNWGDCDPNNPKNARTRVSLKIEEGGTTLLVDTSPDLREQLLKAGLDDLTAILYTHEHADHTHGIDNIRSINWLTGHTVPLYADARTMQELKKRFDYIFEPMKAARFMKPSIEPHVINGPLQFETIKALSFSQQHGDAFSLGYRFNDFGYSTDVSALDEKAFEILEGVKVWVVGAIREKPHAKHANLETVLSWIERIKPARAYLTHMDHSMDYDTLMRRLPDGVEPAYDGLEIDL
ncbi:MAG TPA: MBL fold metallo-hydrolase [Rhodospirillaceae bacterium]|nr:MBL fold metallo-hydrolase [Rhodospirillaceae bacterium]